MLEISPLFNKEAERSLLSCILKNPRNLNILPDVLVYDDFTDQDYVNLYNELIRYSLDNIVDINLIKSRPGINANLVDSLLQINVNEDNIKEYYAFVREASARRLLKVITSDINNSVEDSRIKLSSILKKVEDSLYFACSRQRIPLKRVDEIVDKVYATVLRRSKDLSEGKKPDIGIETGFLELDSLTCGMQRGDMWLIAGSTSEGKTELMLQICNHVTTELKLPCLIFSHELTKEHIIERLLSLNSRIPLHRIRTGNLGDERNDERLRLAFLKINEAPLYIDDSVNLTHNDIYSRTRWLRMVEPTLAVVADDYIQLCMGDRSEGKREQEISSVGRMFKRISKEFNVGVLALSQLNTDPEKRGQNQIPRVNDLRESKAPGHDSSVVLLLHLPLKYDEQAGYDKTTVNLVIAKNRHGETKVIKMKNNLDIQMFEEV